MEFLVQFQKLCHLQARRFIFALCLIAATHLFFQSLTLPCGNAPRSLFPCNDHNLELKRSKVDKFIKDSITLEDIDNGEESFDGPNTSKDNVTDMIISVTVANDMSLEKVLLLEKDKQSSSLQQIVDNRTSSGGFSDVIGGLVSYESGSHEIFSESQASTLHQEDLLIKNTTQNDSKFSIGSLSSEDDRSLGRETEVVSFESEREFLHSDVDAESNTSMRKENLARKKMPSETPPKSVVAIDRMNQILARHFRSPHSMKPQWASSPPDMEILDAKEKIVRAHIPQNSQLYAPIFRNISMFMRSYEFMERTLKVYIYKDGEKPIFHQPILKGLYASEGWFMKLLEENMQFVTKDPKKAHLFYMAFSSRMLEHTLYVPNSYNRSNLRQFVKEYSH